MTFFTANGGRANEGRMLINGMPVAASFNGGGVSTFIYDVANTDEMQVLVSGGLGEAEAGGPSVNLVPRSGGNTFNGQAFYSGTGDGLRSDNIDDYLRSVGLTRPPALLNSVRRQRLAWRPDHARPAVVLRQRARLRERDRSSRALFANRNAGDATTWDYAQDTSVEARSANRRDIFSFRLTGQVSARNRVSFSHEYQHRCSGSAISSERRGLPRRAGRTGSVSGRSRPSPESWPGYHDFPYNVTQATWTSPMSNRVLLEAGFSRFQYLWAGFGQAPPDALTGLIPVTESQAIDDHRANFTYRGMYDPLGFGWADNDANPNNWRASMSYVTGAHNLKVGYQGSYQRVAAGQGRQHHAAAVHVQQPRAERRRLLPSRRGGSRTTAPRRSRSSCRISGRRGGSRCRARCATTGRGAGRRPRATARRRSSQFNPAPITFPRTVSVAGYNDITHARGWRLGRLRQRQDRAQGEHRQVPAERHQRRELHGQQPGRPHRDETCLQRGWVDGQRQLHRRLRSEEPGAAGQPGVRRRPVRGADRRQR